MKFDCGETWEEKRKRLEQWHRWFAWHPVKVEDHDCRWFEVVERQRIYYRGMRGSWWITYYRAVKAK